MAYSSLAQLAEQSKLLTSHIGGQQLPHIERGIDQIENQSRKLAAKAAKPVDMSDNKAHFFLAKGGVDANVMHSQMSSINLKPTFEPFQPMYDTDTEAFLRHQHEQAIINTIDESRRETVQDFDSNFESSLNNDWERTKKRIFEELGQSVGVDGKDLASRSFRASTSLGLSQALKPYYSVVNRLCEHRLQGNGIALASAFADAYQNAHKDQVCMMHDTWTLLMSVLQEQMTRTGLLNPMTKDRRFAKAYLMSPYNSPEATRLRQALVLGSKAFLETHFRNHIEEAVAHKAADASLGGAPSFFNKVRSYIQLKYMHYGSSLQPNLELAGGHALWAQIYYLFRCGEGQEALKFATEHEQHFSPADRQFIGYFSTYLKDSGTLAPEQRERLLSDFNQRIRYSSDTVDPYKFTLFKIIGRCELNKKTTPVITVVEDFMWLQLLLIRDNQADTMPQEKYDLADFQALVLKFGPSQFNPKNNNPLQYFQVLIHSQQFEQAIHYLSSAKAFTLETVHMAITLTYHGLLRIPTVHRVSDPNLFSTSTDAQGRQLSHYDFAELMHRQARAIADQSPVHALDYLYQICLNTDLTPTTNTEQISLCHSYIQELVLQAKDYAALLGSTQHGIKTPGVIEKYLPLIKIENSSQFVREITIEAAKSKAREGSVDDAIQLYGIAESYNQVMDLYNRQLAEYISNPGLQSTAGESGPNVGTIRRQLTEFRNDPKISQQISARSLDTCTILLKLVDFMNLYDRAKYDAAIAEIESLNLIPLEADMSTIAKKAEQFQSLDESIARNFPTVLLKTMESMYQLSESYKMSPYDEAGRRDHRLMLKRRSRTLMMFAGSIKFRMPADTYARLNQLDVLISA
ncbi:MAG: NIC-domain-containing protein [Podila humilis]|nr:MAG: NIC-domain-containing protein [Podila humilis]